MQAELAKVAMYFGESTTGDHKSVVNQVNKFVKDFDKALVDIMKKINFL